MSVAVVCSVGLAGPVSAVGDLPGAVVIDLAPDPVFTPVGPWVFTNAEGSVTATTTVRVMSTGLIDEPPVDVGFFRLNEVLFGIFPQYWADVDPDVAPGDYYGRFAADRELIVTFDGPVSGAGITLYNDGAPGVMSTGSTVTAYAGPDATGGVIGAQTSPNTSEVCCPFSSSPPYWHLYFAGVAADGVPIRSIKITPTVPANGWGIDVIAVSPAAGGDPACNIADVVEPFGTLDVDDVLSFLAAFAAGNSSADVAEPADTLDIDDVLSFLGAFAQGCP